MENRLIFDSHLSEDMLEEYVFNRLPEDECARFEEHFLVCPRCQQNLARTDEYVRLIKQAATEWHGAPLSAAWRSLRVRAAGVLVVGLVAVAAVAITIRHSWRPAHESAPVELNALRGGAGPAMARAPAGDSIGIVIDTTDLDERHNLRVEVVDANGRPVWKSQAMEPAAGSRLSIRIAAPLNAGVYWIRLYSLRSELLREFGLRAE